MKVFKINPENPELHLLQQIADIILNDGVIGYPTETVYGLGANAFSDVAVERVYQLKQRPQNKPILVIASDLNQVKKIVAEFPQIAYSLALFFWPGPLTMVLKAAPGVNRRLLGEGATIGIRIPKNQICLELLHLCAVPLTSTSANISGGSNPISAQEVAANFNGELDAIIDGGISRSRISSTVLDLTLKKPVIRRQGIIKKEEIERVIGNEIDETG